MITIVCRFFSLLACVAIILPAKSKAAPGPNVIVILVDDLGYFDLACYGATEVKTPRIDALASGGTRFTDYYAAAPICSPSRAGLLTGCYPRRIGMEVWVQRADSDRGLHPSERTMAELFRDAGYATACIGKWHLGDRHAFLPRQQGFDEYFGLLHNLDPVETIYFGDEGVPLVRGDGEVVKRPADPAELTRLYTDEAIRFISASREKPFFLYLPHTMLHEPVGVGEDFRGRSAWGDYGDAIEELDFHTGRLLDALEESGLADDTVVLFLSDNGRGPGRTPEQAMKGNKLTTWECGIRVPAVAWGPGLGIPTGRECGEVVHAMDWYPTLASIAGIRVPDDRVIDGRDLAPLLLGRTETIPQPEAALSLNSRVPLRRRWEPGGEWKELFTREEYLNAFFYHGSEGQLAAVRSGSFKLFLSPAPTLYDLSEDPGETTPVRGPMLRKLRGMAVMFQEEMNRDARPAGFAE